MLAAAHPVVVDLGDNPLLAFVAGLFTPTGAGWLVGAVVTGRWLLQGGRYKTLWATTRTWLRRGRTLAALEGTLGEIRADGATTKATVAEHLRESEQIKNSLTSAIEAVNGRLDVVIALSREVRHEVKNNGGSSVKDSTHRIERALGLPEPTEHETPTDPTPTPWPPMAAAPLPERAPA